MPKYSKSAVIMRQKEVIYILFALLDCMAWKEGNVLFIDALNSLFTVICVGHMVKDHSEEARGRHYTGYSFN